MRKREGSINVICTLPPYFTQINPLGKIPALKKGKFVLSESAAIATYVANAHDLKGELYPRGPKTSQKGPLGQSFGLPKSLKTIGGVFKITLWRFWRPKWL